MLKLSNNTFLNNYAGNEGGCVKYTNNSIPIMENNTFQNNFAFYGNNLAGFISKALILKIINIDEWVVNYSGDGSKIYVENFCSYPLNGTNCLRNEFTYIDASSPMMGNISNFNISLNKSQRFQGKIAVSLLDAHGQIVTAQNAIAQLNRSQIRSLIFNESQNVYSLDQNLANKNSILSRLQVFTANLGIMTIGNFEVDYEPG